MAYDLTVYVTVNDPTVYANYVGLYVGTSATGPWTYKYSYALSGQGLQGQHTWNVKNQQNGSYWWFGFGGDSAGRWSTTGALGAYTTP